MEIESTNNDFKMETNLTKVDKSELLSLDNPRYEELIHQYSHLKGVTITDRDNKPQFPVHIVLGSGEYARIKTENRPRVGKEGEPIAELTKLGLFFMSPGQEFDRTTMLLTQTSQSDYEELCRLDVLGLEDTPEHDQRVVHDEFKEQLTRHREGWYTGQACLGKETFLSCPKTRGEVDVVLTTSSPSCNVTVSLMNMMLSSENRRSVEW